ncbi:unnamed protein product [Rotaria sp. Silwood1]|nr:unnamed protein product [Rotaria sp. Silwood1]CAF4899878.1 unnamed protein product [Rotaria sp. Silwood1]
MKLYVILFTLIFLIGFCTSTDQLLAHTSLQDYVDNFVADGKIQLLSGRLKLNDSVIRQIWSFFKEKYHRFYSSNGEEKARLNLFANHLKYVILSNFQESSTYQLGLNEFSDWTSAEFNAFKTGLKVPHNLRRDIIMDVESDTDALERSLEKLYERYYHTRRLKRNLQKRRHKDRRFWRDWFDSIFNRNNATSKPNNIIDWRAKNVVSPIKNQGNCGSCYAFAAVGVLESLYAMKTKSESVTEFSPQQIVDCSKNDGCGGGLFPPTMDYIIEKGSKIATNTAYPYGEKRDSCRINDVNEIELGKVQYEQIPVGDEKQLAEAVTNYGPIFIGINANGLRFRFYRNGVFKKDKCRNKPDELNHAVIIIGHGYDEGLKMPYWLIKNSWGTKWGENGYLRILKDSDNMCGIASMAFITKLS